MEQTLRGWDDVKNVLAGKGFSLSLGYTDIWQDNARGGLSTHRAQRNEASYDVIMQLDTEKAGLWKGGLFNVYLEGAFGKGVGPRYVGDLMAVNFDAESAASFQVSEAWYEQHFLQDKILWRTGKLFATDTFDTNAYANNEVTQFINGGLRNNPTIPFPDYSLGTQVVVTPRPWVYGQIGVYDAEANGRTTGFHTAFHGPAHFFLINEYGLMPKFELGKKMYPGTYRAGYWYDPNPKEDFIQPEDSDVVRTSNGDWGAYISCDQLVFKENDKEDDKQGLGLFLRYGHANGDVNTISNFWSFGASYTGLIPKRDEDVCGAGLAYASLSEALGHVQPGLEHETAIEVYYNIHVNKYIQLTPDLQVIVDPGGSDELRNAIVVGLRLAAYF